MDPAVSAALQAAREAEKEQALFYRALAAQAEERGDAVLSERFNELHADEQHHLSRLTARLLELGETPAALDHVRPRPAAMDTWEADARLREKAEVARYTELAALPLDPETAALVSGVLRVERAHAEHLGGKWTDA